MVHISSPFPLHWMVCTSPGLTRDFGHPSILAFVTSTFKSHLFCLLSPPLHLMYLGR
jgi:hypothetical protein